ncbi:MAG: pyridoxal-phosphate dependent enzyme, partial [Chlorobi bacterium]|nr:pyridoxal-phosphate dependent enzyme [Chlorobiota bacterium]
MNQGPALSLDDIELAAERIHSFAHHTPVLTSSGINRMAGAQLYFKCENFQKAGAFKFRGACNAVLALDREVTEAGVATHSSGNFAQALSLAARIRRVPAYIVMPENATPAKKAAVEEYGGNITLCEPTLEAREEMLAEVRKRTDAVFIHPYNNELVIAGQGTAALELLREIDELDTIVAPVGGGGLVSGTALAVAGLSEDTRVIGVEPSGADDARRSLEAGRIIPSENPRTIADGLLTSLGDNTFSIIRAFVERIVTVDDTYIVRAMRLLWERMKIVVEPSAAVTLGAILQGTLDVMGERVGIILSGGNVDLDAIPWLG